jgi:hydrogenase-4 component B
MLHYFIYIAILCAAVSGLPGLILSRTSPYGQRVAGGFMCCSALLGLAGAGLVLYSGENLSCAFPWQAMGNAIIGIDALSAFFLVPVFLMGGLGSIYGLGYWSQSRHPSNSRKLTLFWGLLVSGMAILVISKHAMAFLLGWEIMALSAFFLVTTEDNRTECRSAGWIYLIATHIGTLILFALFALWRSKTGSYLFQPIGNNSINLGLMNVFFVLAIIGFGLKAGIMPFHFWLPAAHATAPSHVSAMLSGVVLKMGVYGLVRWLSLFPSPPYAWGSIIITLGFVSGLLGVVFAIAQHDLKRLLAYHSVENIGIILIGLGVAMLGRSANRPELVVLGMAGCFLHVWNHCFFKSLLFLCAGSVVHHTHTRQIDQLGGLAKKMPWTAALFLIGAVAICGLPPLNGFISELFVYLGLFQIVTGETNALAAAVSVPVLAMIGALAGACFVKVYGTVFLGNPRSHNTKHCHESALSMRWPMVILAAVCVLIGIAPMLVSNGIDRAIAVWNPVIGLNPLSLTTVTPLIKISILALILITGIVVATIFIMYRNTKATNPSVLANTGTWDCGYACPTNQMQYTASSFAQSIVTLFQWVLRPREHNPHLTGIFPKPVHMSSHIDEIVLDRILLPISRITGRCTGWFHRFQQGLIQQYILYILITIFLMLCTQMPIKEFISHWFTH